MQGNCRVIRVANAAFAKNVLNSAIFEENRYAIKIYEQSASRERPGSLTR